MESFNIDFSAVRDHLTCDSILIGSDLTSLKYALELIANATGLTPEPIGLGLSGHALGVLSWASAL